ncbi:MAG TPA: type III-A CRISPR-associated protein Csm2 [Herpetosiphon sp.]|uniref:CRISPR system Cms protein Csm2 n=1 Tax=Herpetosiphon aurantiacus (strain ATCC 23779 / DSM 785 / 114-95) TaxID=316274 RepID=A9AZH0_HERA2|nr:type III-A CRISPR-associated protein Csm2 [Herpetosiphon sp.]ABX05114.1 CRISPR-associated protein, Csm2 family [Herpetosiphon aurantiacus DSM 785]HBW49097.1 type III-A CRISPR-associated protein Csm2 [Herpetosiphon sp.]
MPEISEQEREAIIAGDDVEKLVEAAQKIGEKLARNRLTTSQIRGIFGTVRRIEMDWVMPSLQQQRAEAVRRAQREFALLQPRLAYQAKRERGGAVQALSDELTPAIKLVLKAKADKPDIFYQRFRNFVDFFEAILAYHRAFGGQ